MRIILTILLALLVLLFPAVDSRALASPFSTDVLQNWEAGNDQVPMAYPRSVPPQNLPPIKLPPTEGPPREIHPKITVLSPSASANKPMSECANCYLHFKWSYVGNIGGTVNIKLSTSTIATGVPVQGGQGSYSWKVLEEYSGKGSRIYTVIVEAGNGSTVGTGGTVEVLSAKTGCKCMGK